MSPFITWTGVATKFIMLLAALLTVLTQLRYQLHIGRSFCSVETSFRFSQLSVNCDSHGYSP